MLSRILLFVGVLLLAGTFFIRASNVKHTTTLVATLLQADGAATDTAAPLAAVKTYVSAHLGTHAKFSLTGSYQRELAAAKMAATAQATNSQIYAAAQTACGGKTDSITQAKCNEAYLSAHLVPVPAAAPLTAPVLSSYQYDFKAPVWTPDLAGVFAAGGLIALVGGVIGLIRSRR